MNILLACDSSYYSLWAINCINSIKKQVPWINITVVVVNPENIEELPNVRYVYESVDFPTEKSKIAYYQAVRFIRCYDLFPNGELVMTIDCDTVLQKSFTENEFKDVCSTIHVQRHQKANRWMAGLVTYGADSIFRKNIKETLLSKSLDEWEYGWDQLILNTLDAEHNYKKLEVGDWMSFGKGKGKFITLKGNQKIKEKFLENYNKILETIDVET
jgi:hypothetical protein